MAPLRAHGTVEFAAAGEYHMVCKSKKFASNVSPFTWVKESGHCCETGVQFSSVWSQAYCVCRLEINALLLRLALHLQSWFVNLVSRPCILVGVPYCLFEVAAMASVALANLGINYPGSNSICTFLPICTGGKFPRRKLFPQLFRSQRANAVSMDATREDRKPGFWF